MTIHLNSFPVATIPATFAAFLAVFAAPSFAKDINVNNDATLLKAIVTAKPGDRIILGARKYGAMMIKGQKNHSGKVTIVGNGAKIDNLQILDSAGWAIEGAEFIGVPGPRGRVIRIDASDNIRFANNFVHGLSLNNDPWDDKVGGLLVRAGKNVEIINNRFQDLHLAVTLSSTSNAIMRGNRIAYVKEGLNIVSVAGLHLRCNRFSHFFPNYALKEHPDAVQSWNYKAPSRNLLVEGNYISTGDKRAVQGMFIQGPAEHKDAPSRRNADFIFRDNIYYGSSAHGISVGGATNLNITQNTVLASPHVRTKPVPKRTADGRNSSALVPRIRVTGANTTGTVTKNIATSYDIPPQFVNKDNLLVQSSRDAKGTKLSDVFANPPRDDEVDPPIERFKLKPGSQPEKMGLGARLICGNELPPSPGGAENPPPPKFGTPAR